MATNRLGADLYWWCFAPENPVTEPHFARIVLETRGVIGFEYISYSRSRLRISAKTLGEVTCDDGGEDEHH